MVIANKNCTGMPTLFYLHIPYPVGTSTLLSKLVNLILEALTNKAFYNIISEKNDGN